MDQSLFDWVAEAMAPVGVVTLRKMMGGAALYCDGVIFAMLDNGQLWFKSDAESDAVWDAAGCERFTYDFGNGRSGTMNYRRAPGDAYDDADALRPWGQLAMEAGRRVPPKKPRKKT